jgi:hypothetical protein
MVGGTANHAGDGKPSRCGPPRTVFGGRHEMGVSFSGGVGAASPLSSDLRLCRNSGLGRSARTNAFMGGGRQRHFVRLAFSPCGPVVPVAPLPRRLEAVAGTAASLSQSAVTRRPTAADHLGRNVKSRAVALASCFSKSAAFPAANPENLKHGEQQLSF